MIQDKHQQEEEEDYDEEDDSSGYSQNTSSLQDEMEEMDSVDVPAHLTSADHGISKMGTSTKIDIAKFSDRLTDKSPTG